MKCPRDVAASPVGASNVGDNGARHSTVKRSRRHLVIGMLATAAILTIYMIIVSVAQGIKHAVEQAWSLKYWMTPLAIGFGVQASLFSYLRDGLRHKRSAANASVTASGGVSTGAMLACCAHHLSDVLPMLGIAGAAAFLAGYQTLFLGVGIVSNIVGITFMLDAVQCAGLSMPKSVQKWRMRVLRNWTAGFGIAAFAVALALTFSQVKFPGGVR